MPRIEGRRRIGLLVLALLGLAAASEGWLRGVRPSAPGLRARARLVVTSSNDAGAGSLREAIFAAARAEVPAIITFRTRKVVLKSPLPPLVNPKGVVVDAREAQTEIDARGVSEGSVLEVRSPDSLLEGLRVRSAVGAAILVRARGVRLRGLQLSDCAEAVTLAEGASEVVLEESRFEANATGVTIPPEARAVTVRNSRFARHDQAAVWAVSAQPAPGATADDLVVRENQFEDDRISVVLINVAGRVERNEFRRAREAAVYVMGQGAVLRENRTREGAGLGIFADEAEGALIEANELDHNAAVAIIVRSSGGTVVQRNRIYSNGYGIAVVFGQKARPNLLSGNLLFAQSQDAFYIVGGSPLLRENRALQNRFAAARVLDYLPREGEGALIPAEPLLQDNVFQDNSQDAPVRGVYRQPPKEEGVAR